MIRVLYLAWSFLRNNDMKSLLNMVLIAGLMLGCQYSQVLPEQGSYMAARINGTDWLVEVNMPKSVSGVNVFNVNYKTVWLQAFGNDNSDGPSPFMRINMYDTALDDLKLPYTFPRQKAANTPSFGLSWRDTNLRPFDDAQCNGNRLCGYSAGTGDDVTLTITQRTATGLEGTFAGVLYLRGWSYTNRDNRVIVRNGRFRMQYQRNTQPKIGP